MMYMRVISREHFIIFPGRITRRKTFVKCLSALVSRRGTVEERRDARETTTPARWCPWAVPAAVPAAAAVRRGRRRQRLRWGWTPTPWEGTRTGGRPMSPSKSRSRPSRTAFLAWKSSTSSSLSIHLLLLSVLHSSLARLLLGFYFVFWWYMFGILRI